jgi:hypothetical protein
MDITHKEVEMSLKKVFFVKLLVLVLTLSLVGPVFSQGNKNKIATFAGVIQWVSPDFKYIAIPSQESKIFLPPTTKVFDGQGNSLKLSDLRRGLNIVLEVTRNPDGSQQRTIIVKK